jgi:hypothetical protein
MENSTVFSICNIAEFYDHIVKHNTKPCSIYFNVDSIENISNVKSVIYKNNSKLRMKLFKSEYVKKISIDDIINECHERFNNRIKNAFLICNDKKQYQHLTDKFSIVKCIHTDEYIDLLKNDDGPIFILDTQYAKQYDKRINVVVLRYI